MRGFPFGALSSSESLDSGRTMWPCAEREAPHVNSLPGGGICSADVASGSGQHVGVLNVLETRRAGSLLWKEKCPVLALVP